MNELPTTYVNTCGEVCPVLYDDYVTDTQTGIVHLCGGHGDEDFRILTANGIEPKNVVEDIKDLQKHIENIDRFGAAVQNRAEKSYENITHSYPVDWREKNKVYKALTEQTYLEFDFAKIKACLKQMKLSTKDRKRLEDMIFSRKDWCISRQRKWGVSIPDSNDILDVWFDSGTVWSMYDEPADLYIEGQDQYRGWFQTSTILAAMVDQVPTKRILSHGFVLNDLYEKFSKSSENYTPVEKMYEIYGPDVIRMWVFLSDYKSDVVLSDDSMHSAAKQYFKVRNFARYLVNNLHRTDHSHADVHSDLVTKMNKLKEMLQVNIDEFDLAKGIRNVITFINNYSASLTEDIKNEFYESDINSDVRVRIENEFHYVVSELNRLLYPFVPFLSVEIDTALEPQHN